MAYNKNRLRWQAYLDLHEWLHGHRPEIKEGDNGWLLMDGRPLNSKAMREELEAMRQQIAAAHPPQESIHAGGRWAGADPIPGMYYACDRDSMGAWQRLFGPYAIAQDAEDIADELDYGRQGGWVVVYSREAEKEASRGEREPYR